MQVKILSIVDPLRALPVVFLASLLALVAEPANAQSTAQLQTLLNDTVAQLKLVYRHDAAELHGRYEELSKAVKAWREADRTDENNRRLEAWLRHAIRNSMPGSREALPPLPGFESLPVPARPAVPEPEHSLLPTNPSAELPATPEFRVPTIESPATSARTESNAQPAITEANKPAASETTAPLNEAPQASEADASLMEAPVNDEMQTADPLPDVEEVPGIDELPDVDPLPEIEEDPALIEAIGDPFLDDAESSN